MLKLGYHPATYKRHDVSTEDALADISATGWDGACAPLQPMPKRAAATVAQARLRVVIFPPAEAYIIWQGDGRRGRGRTDLETAAKCRRLGRCLGVPDGGCGAASQLPHERHLW